MVQWTSGTGANNNYFQRIDQHSATPLTYDAAVASAAAMTFNTGTSLLTGRLAVFDKNYSDAFSFVQTNAPPTNIHGLLSE